MKYKIFFLSIIFTCICCSKHKSNYNTYLIEVVSKSGSSSSITSRDTIINFFSAIDKSEQRDDVLKYSGEYYLKCFSETDTIIYSINNDFYYYNGKIYQAGENLEAILGL